MKKAYMVLIPIFATILFMSIFASMPKDNSPIQNPPIFIDYGSNLCTQVTRLNGTVEPSQCGHNVLYDTGAEAIEQYLGAGAGGGDAFDWVELCNATAGCGIPVAAKTEAYTAFAACGLSNVAGTYSSLGNGNWTISHTFTATCDNLLINASRLRNDDDDDLAGNNFTLVTLHTGDEFLVNRTVWVQ